MLSDAAVGTPRFLAPRAAAKVAAALARDPAALVRRARGLADELRAVATGRSQLRPPKGDRRFADRAWERNWLFRRMMQSYLALGETVDGLVSDARLDWRTERQARFVAENVLDALSPTNFPWSNPTVLKEAIDRGGANFVTGARQFLRDVSTPPRLPASVDVSKFEVGGNLALSPGSVVLRTDVFELIQYQSQTEQVREVPLLLVPPTINKFYVLDLAPGRSMIEYLVAQGQQVFVISWRNPESAQGHFDLDTYAQAVLEAGAAVDEIGGEKTVHVAAACSGGLISAGLLGHLAARGLLPRVAGLTLFVCALDNERAGTPGAFTSRDVAAAAVAQSARRGYLDGRSLAGVFAWLRPNDLIWGYVVNNYLLGKEPPAFDVLYWNQDTVRLAAGLHRDFIRIGLDNSFTQPGALKVLGTPVDLREVDVDVYNVAGLTDHIVPWENPYRSAALFGGSCRFVLSTSGHIQALVNPPSPESRSTYRVTDDFGAQPEVFLERAGVEPGSWWPDWVRWLGKRSGELKPAPKKLGSREHRAQAKAPGSYVHAR
jgi:polyhydroxyalkanoate synthase